MLRNSIVTILNIILVCNLIVGSHPALGKKSEASSELSAEVIVPPVAGVDVQSIPVAVNGEVLNLPPVLEESSRDTFGKRMLLPPGSKNCEGRRCLSIFPRLQ
ncbi:MAG: hypothetical protein IPK68_18575 [Bdellovibrionales bacterium]|nr:hypothetical protein [Bdellovibrionales bacterium]